MKLDRDQFFELMAIPVKRGEAAQYFFGDNLEGYLEGFTHRYAQGAGYILRRAALYRDFLSWCGDRLNDRGNTEGATIYPYGVRHRYGPSWWDEGILLRRRKAVALRVFSRRPQSLALAPMFALRGGAASVCSGDGAMMISNPERSLHIAVSSIRPFKHHGTTERDGLYAPIFRTAQDESEFTLYVAFGRSAEEALSRARRLREEDAVSEHKKSIFAMLTRSTLFTDNTDYNRAVCWAKLSSLFMLTDEFGTGLWAGLPWFKDNWGRDTFIALPGALLVSGHFAEARDVIRTFARRQDTDPRSPTYGRVPNRVAGETDVIYNTADGTPWLIRALGEYLNYTGDLAFGQEMYPVVECAIEGAVKGFADARGFFTHDDADTWMDARIEGKAPWSARGNRANDIQALWHTALLIGARIAEIAGRKAAAKKWRARAEKLATAFTRTFWDGKKKLLADRIRPDGSRDLKPRPNQLMLLSIPFDEGLLDREIEARVLKNAFEELCFPYGICSLSPAHPYFHPYHHRDDRWHFDAAYHNGTIWGWNAGFTVSALCRHDQTECAWQLARNLADQILNLGCRGGMSELLDALPDPNGRIVPSGTWQQTWSTAEFARNAYQDFGGFAPRLLDNEIRLAPHIPAEWQRFSAEYPCGPSNRLRVHFTRQHGKEVFLIEWEGGMDPIDIELRHTAFERRFVVRNAMRHGDTLTIVIDEAQATVGCNGHWAAPVKGVKHPSPKPLSFANPPAKKRFKTLETPHYLQRIIESGKFE